ncbi:MAG: hypothetical protein HY907_15910 [Deltaproteobacteria bacterium]|nr:hypothetical protein [Deltaproteobacteria bacterium]
MEGIGAKQSAIPDAVSWETFTRDPVHQGATGTCALFADVAAIEIQYLLDNCDALPEPPAACPIRPEDDDPSAAGLVLVRTDDRGRLFLDLSEQLVLSCSGLGYAWGGAAVWPFQDEDGANRLSSFEPDEPYDLKIARTGWGYWQFLDRIGTVPETVVPYRLPFEREALHDYDAAYARLYGSSALDPFPGTCPLVHRRGAGDPDGDGPLEPPEPFAEGGCEIARVAERTGEAAPVFFRVPLGAHRAVAADDVVDYLAAGYVVVDVVGGNLVPDPEHPGRSRCDEATCAFGEPSCAGHVLVLVGYEDGGETLIVRDSNGSHHRVLRGACGYGVGEMSVLLLGDDPLHPGGPAVESLAAPTCSRAEHRELSRWLRDDSDGDGIRNGYDVCLFSANPRLIDRDAPGADPRIVGDGRLLDPVFTDGDAWPDEREEPGDTEWNPVEGLRSGCDSCPGLPVAQPARRTAPPEGFPEDPDPWGWVCDGCPYTPQESYAEYLERIPTDRGDRDGDGIHDLCDTCRRRATRDPRAMIDLDDDGRGTACDPSDVPPAPPTAPPLHRSTAFPLYRSTTPP